jgi:hypothetical protein
VLGFLVASAKLPLMRSTCFFCLALGLLLAGCGDKSSTSAGSTNNASSGGSIATAPVDYLKSAANAKQSAVKTVDTSAIDKAIQLFNIDQGRNPKDLNELVEKKFLPEIPAPPYGSKLVYDANAGTVKVVKE